MNNTIPIYVSAIVPRIGTIGKNHIQSSTRLWQAALFVCSESDTFLKNYNILETSDTYYLNYDKRKVLALINDRDNPLSESDIMNKEELDNAIKQAKPIKKAKVEYKAEKILANRIRNLIETTEEIVSRKVASKILTELRDNQRLSDWVNEGLNLHKESSNHTCAFCGNVLADDRIEELEAHFSDALSRLNRIVNEKRVAMLCDGGESLKQATEYDYVFFTVYGMKDKVLSKQESIFCGNVCRKLVESFLSFKFPKQRADLMALLNAALPGKANDIVRERIYKFINIYSHDKKINVFEELDADILDANSIQIVNDILDMIRNLDEKHYNAMIDKYCDEVCDGVN